MNLVEIYLIGTLITIGMCLPTLTPNQMIIDMIQPISTQCVNNVEYFKQIQFTPMISTVKSYGISLIGFQGIVSSIVSFQSQIKQVNGTHIIIKSTCKDQTIFTRLKYSYIIINSVVQYLDIYSQCFLCSPQQSLTGQRKYNFSLQQHTTGYTKKMKITSSISGLNSSALESNGINFIISTNMIIGDNHLYQTITTYDQTVISSICITTIIYNFALTAFTSYQTIVEIQQKHIKSAIGASQIQPNFPCYQNSNSMYYGISNINIDFESAQSQILLFDLSNPSNLNANFQGNDNLVDVTLSAFFIRIKNCLVTQKFDPLTYSCATTCPSQTGANPTTKYCELCYQTCATCQGSGANNCLTCNNGTVDKFRTLLSGSSPSSCICQSGYIESLTSVICTKCSDIIENCDICSNSTFCNLCYAPYAFNSTTNRCGCSDTSKFLSQGNCLPYAGCIEVRTSLNVPAYCANCDTSKNFQLVPATDSCKCKNLFELDLINILCIDRCGDGKVVDNECDDGNLINGDGCSNKCQIQSGYMCFNNPEPTECMKMLNFVLSYKYCQRQITLNQATFVFELSPPLSQFTRMNLIQCFKFSFKGNVTSYTYNDQTGQIYVTTLFEQTLQNQNHDMTLNLNKVGIWTSSLSSSFNVNGINSWIIMDRFASIYKFIIYGMVIVCGLAWIMGIVCSLMGYKNLSLQLMLPIQGICFILISCSSNSPGLRALQLIRFINGYNSFDGLRLKQVTSVDDRRYSYLQYLSNMNYFILVNLLCLIILFVVKGINYVINKKLLKAKQQMDVVIEQQILQVKKNNKRNKNKNQQQVKQQIDQSKLIAIKNKVDKILHHNKISSLILDYVGYRFASVILLIGLQGSIFYLGTFVIYTSQYKLYSSFVNNVACLLAVVITFVALTVYPEQKQKQVYIQFQNKLKYSYTKVYLIMYLIFAMLLIFVSSFQITGLILVPICLISLIIVYLIIKNPYKKQRASCIRVILPVIQQIVLTIPLLMMWILGFIKSIDPLLYFLTTVMIVGCCLIGVILSIIRLLLEYRYNRLMNNKLNLDDLDQDDKQQQQNNDQTNKQLGSGYNEIHQYETQAAQKLINRLNDNDQDNVQTNKPINNNNKAVIINNNNNKQIVNNKNNKNTKNNKDKKYNKEQDNNQHYQQQQHSSIDEQQQEDINTIKQRLRADLLSRRNVLKR